MVKQEWNDPRSGKRTVELEKISTLVLLYNLFVITICLFPIRVFRTYLIYHHQILHSKVTNIIK